MRCPSPIFQRRHARFILALTLAVTLALPAWAQNYNRDEANAENNSEAAVGAPSPALATLQPAQATDLQIRINALDNQVRGLTGEVERLQFRNSQLEQAMQKVNSDHDLRFQQLEAHVGQQDAALKAIGAAQQAAAAPAAIAATPAAAPPATLTTPAKPAGADTAAAAPAELKTPEVKPAEKPVAEGSKPSGVLGTLGKTGAADSKDDELKAQAEYDAAFQFMRSAKYEEAEKSFRSFLAAHPKHRLTENAKYWLAETYYARGHFSDAAVAFAEAYEQFPKGSKAPDNLFKLALSLGSLGKKQDACSTLMELEKTFPKSPPVTHNRVAQEKKTFACP